MTCEHIHACAFVHFVSTHRVSRFSPCAMCCVLARVYSPDGTETVRSRRGSMQAVRRRLCLSPDVRSYTHNEPLVICCVVRIASRRPPPPQQQCCLVVTDMDGAHYFCWCRVGVAVFLFVFFFFFFFFRLFVFFVSVFRWAPGIHCQLQTPEWTAARASQTWRRTSLKGCAGKQTRWHLCSTPPVTPVTLSRCACHAFAQHVLLPAVF